MTPERFRQIREGLGLSVMQFGMALGYQGNGDTISREIRRMECQDGGKAIRPAIARLAYMFWLNGGVPVTFLSSDENAVDYSGDIR